MSETPVFLQAKAAGRAFLLSVSELREVVASSPVTAIPGSPPGIQGVVLHQGEFLPVLDWAAVPGADPSGPSTALAVLRPRLGLPLEVLTGTMEIRDGAWLDPTLDAWAPILAGLCRVGDLDLPVLDPDRLLGHLHRLRIVR